MTHRIARQLKRSGRVKPRCEHVCDWGERPRSTISVVRVGGAKGSQVCGVQDGIELFKCAPCVDWWRVFGSNRRVKKALSEERAEVQPGGKTARAKGHQFGMERAELLSLVGGQERRPEEGNDDGVGRGSGEQLKKITWRNFIRAKRIQFKGANRRSGSARAPQLFLESSKENVEGGSRELRGVGSQNDNGAAGFNERKSLLGKSLADRRING